MSAAWWRDFFDEDYPVLYAPTLDAARTEREVAAAVAILQLKQGMRLLDLCCGTGRHAVALQRRGLRVCGLDASRKLLAVAADKSTRVGAFPAFIQADARELPLDTATELSAMLRKAGFERIECYGDYDRRPFAIDSPLFLAHAR